MSSIETEYQKRLKGHREAKSRTYGLSSGMPRRGRPSAIPHMKRFVAKSNCSYV